jgi:hypothetical protein
VNREDLATAVGAGVVVLVVAVVAIAAAFGPHALHGLFSEDGAAWIQAVGSVGAILVAIWVSNSAERRSQHAASELAALFKACMLDGSYNLLHATWTESSLLVQRSVAEIQDGLEIGRAIDLGRLPPIEALKIVRIRSVISVLLVEANDLINKGSIGIAGADFQRLQHMTETSRDKILAGDK